MADPNRRFVKTSAILLPALLLLAPRAKAQAAPGAPTPPIMFLWNEPARQLVSQGEAVIFKVSLYNGSEQPIFVSRLQGDEFVSFRVTGPDGNEVAWRGERPNAPRRLSPADFTVLEKYHEISVKKVISIKDGAGFLFDKPGQYTVTAEYSLGPEGSFARFAGATKIPSGIFRTKSSFCVEACILEPLPVTRNVPQSALDSVRAFYTYITRYPMLGIPYGRGRKAVWPLLSERLAQELDSLQACDDDYFKRYGKILEANQYKPATPWLEDGLFTGPNDAATPNRFRILSSRAIGRNRVDVQLSFTSVQTYCCGQSADHYHNEGAVTVIRENSRWVIDDYVPLYENDDLLRLSSGFQDCKNGHWVGERPY